ncbi:MAG TPA: DUF4231 domain-containing protein [Archangium sp.]|uniref:DUF4231 domain-containing protein n=1 Tax=Archangium sp. TaxID=1872627 RepID=UPI002E3006E6|nr:DUF4231 domain-containing protein [Archangium sp.]HEX5748855.1 DUF4231 domain-containing protein [Archangium sp.]
MLHSHPTEPELHTGEIFFPNGNRAKSVRVSPGAAPQALIHALGLPHPRALILLIGGADRLPPETHAALRPLLSRGVARAAVEMDALILDGGTRAGIMALMGEGLASRGGHAPLVGVAPAKLVTWPGGPTRSHPELLAPLDEHHSHFVLVDSDTWGGETQTLFSLAAALAKDIPVTVVLVNGGDISKQEALAAVRHGWPLIVLQGSGRLADQLANLLAQPSPDIADPALAEIVADGDLCLFPLEGSPLELHFLLKRELREESILKHAWQRFALCDANAARQQRIFQRLQLWILVLGFLGTFFALLDTQLSKWGYIAKVGPVWRVDLHPLHLDSGVLRIIVLVLIAALTVLLGASSQFKFGTRWISLRAQAETLKREIFRYRCHSGVRNPSRAGRPSCERRLAGQMKSISQQLLRTEPPLSALRTYRGPLPPPSALATGDDGFSALTPFRYIHFRLDDQLAYYRGKVDQLDRRAHRLQWLILAAGGMGTLLAALGAQLWVALTTALVTAITSWLGSQQAETQVVKFNQAAIELENLKAWWCSLSFEEQHRPRHFERLVDSTELVLQAELMGWVQEMKEAMARLQARREEDSRETEPEKHRETDPEKH